MRSSKTIHVISAHAEGEVGDVIVGGVAPPPGATIWEMRETLWRDQTLCNFVLNEPRGGVFRHVNLLVPPKDPRAQMGFIIMEPEDNPPMSGSNSICVATVLLDSGILPMREPVTELVLEAVVKAENLQVSDEEYVEEIEKMAKAYKMTDADLKKMMADKRHIAAVKETILRRKAAQFVVDSAVKSEK